MEKRNSRRPTFGQLSAIRRQRLAGERTKGYLVLFMVRRQRVQTRILRGRPYTITVTF